jgi:Abortive infection C-terminus
MLEIDKYKGINMNEERLIEVETIKNILVAHATGEDADANEYKELRDKLIQDSLIKSKLPRFIFTCRSLSEFWGYIKDESSTYQGRRNHLRDEFHDLLTFLEEKTFSSSPIDEVVSETLNETNAYEVIQAHWEKALERRSNDPEGAITIARTMLESTCKFILDQAEVEYDDKTDLPQLYKKVQKLLNMAPNSHTEPIFQQILGGCTSVIYGLGTLRNKLSDAHGQGIKVYKPSLRHAQFAVNMAGAMAEFLISTWTDKRLSLKD